MAIDAFFIGQLAGSGGVNALKPRTDSRLETISVRPTYRNLKLSATMNTARYC
jgi:hypothetical protein